MNGWVERVIARVIPPRKSAQSNRAFYVFYYVSLGVVLALKTVIGPFCIPNYIPVMTINAIVLLLLLAVAATPYRKLENRIVLHIVILFPLFFFFIEALYYLPYLYYRNYLLNIFYMICLLAIYCLFGIGTLLVRRYWSSFVLGIIAAVYQYLLFGRIPDMTMLAQGALYIVTALVIVILWQSLSLINKNNRMEQLLAEQKRLHDELLQMSARLFEEKRLSGLAVMTAGLAHEINNPINYLAGNLPFLRKYTTVLVENARKNVGSDEGEQQKVNESAEEIAAIHTTYAEGLNRIREIIRSMQQIFLGGAGHDQECRINAILTSTVAFLGLKDSTKYHINIETDESVAIKGRPGDFYSLFTNLITNAMEAMPDGGHITISGSRHNPVPTEEGPYRNGYLLFVTDYGCGIEQDRLQNITDPFYSTKHAGRNMGLGLALCKSIIEKYDGTIQIDSRKNEFTQVSLFFPKEYVCE